MSRKTWNELYVGIRHAQVGHGVRDGPQRWQIGGVFEASTGVPFTPGFGGDARCEEHRPQHRCAELAFRSGLRFAHQSGNPNHYIKTQCFAVPNPITLRGNLGRNTIIGPGLVNLDFSLFKTTASREFRYV